MASPNTSYLPKEPTSSHSTHETTRMAQRRFEFFVTTEKPHQPEEPQRDLVRRLVMRNFFEMKCSGVEKEGESSEMSSEATVKAKGRLKTRFRLGKMTEEGKSKGQNASKRLKVEEGSREKRRLMVARTRPGLSEKSQPDFKTKTESRRVSPTESDGAALDKTKDCRWTLLDISPSAHRFDPFDVLPVPGTQQLDLLLRLHKSGSRINSLTINTRKTWWSFISNDAGLLHATLATWALYGMLVHGLSELRVEKLRHKNEAIREINMKIGDLGGTMTDELVGTVATLASFENLLGVYDAAQLHIAALKHMVNARGGLFAFGHNDGLIRGIQWVDFHTATVFRTAPAFPFIHLDPDTPPLPNALLEEAAYTSPTSLLQLSVAAVDCFNIFYRLHRLALAISSQWIWRVSRATFSTLLYETEHIILSVQDYSRDFLFFDLETEDKQDEKYEERKMLADGASVAEALLTGTQMFVYGTLREIPPQARIFSILLERLRVAIDRPNVPMLGLWKKAKNLNTLLWVLMVASSVVMAPGGRTWWISQLLDVVEELGIGSQMELEGVLKRVAWTDVFFGDVLKGVWAERCEILNRSQAHHARELGQGKGDKRLAVPVEFEKERWKVGGWYV